MTHFQRNHTALKARADCELWKVGRASNAVSLNVLRRLADMLLQSKTLKGHTRAMTPEQPPEVRKTQERLVSVPTNIKAAVAITRQWHRHAPGVVGGIFAVAVRRTSSETPCGVAIVGRPVARLLDNGTVAEVTRVTTDGTPNACSKLYGLCYQIGHIMGYPFITTTTLQGECGASLRAAGWIGPFPCGGGSWNRPSRSRTDKHDMRPKNRWYAPTPAALARYGDAREELTTSARTGNPLIDKSVTTST